MNKETLLETVSIFAAAGDLSEAELTAAYREGAGGEAAERQTRYSTVLYFIGGGVVVMGIVALIAQVWDDLGSVLRVAVTLGAYLVKITNEYFSDSLGWPLALVISGMMLMGVGFLTFRLKRRYLTE